MYFAVKLLCKAIVHSFFREITVLNPERVPAYGPVIFVGNHNNQFVDASMLIATLPRTVRFLIAEKSLSMLVVGHLARAVGCIAVARPQDKKYTGIGGIYWDANENAHVVRGRKTRFGLDLHVGDRLAADVGNESASFTVGNIHNDECVSVKESLLEIKPTKCPPISFSVIPRVDQTAVFSSVVDCLKKGDAIGVFPEGGSHDRQGLLPLKPGVAIMAFRAALQGAEDVLVVPVGLNYYQGHKILSRATIQIGKPFVVSDDLVELYTHDSREAVQQLLKEIEVRLTHCLVSAPEDRSLRGVRLCVSLYAPESFVLPPEKYHTLYYQFSRLFREFYEDPELTLFIEKLRGYSDVLEGYGIEDHEVRSLKQSIESSVLSFLDLMAALIVSLVVGCSLIPMWGPVRYAASVLAEKHRVRALAASTVKVKGTDVVASYKIIVMIVLLPVVNLIHSALFAFLITNTPWKFVAVLVCGQVVLNFLYYHSVRYFAKIAPLFRKARFQISMILGKLNSWREAEISILTERMRMQLEVRRTVRELGKQLPDFEEALNSCVPDVVLNADSKRIARRLANDDFFGIQGAAMLECREEIL